ncbi:MAG: hypothetical protein JST00_10460 [Deltaproteobacteria bacterium]|nr:hypothetical protein [Deltaproteobacteria bacterium]
MLIAIERRKLRALQIHERLGQLGVAINVPWAVLVEWWRGRTDIRETILRTVDVETPTVGLAKLAGAALAATSRLKPATTIDAIVMASAAMRGDVVYTTDVDDLERLRSFFPSVRVLGV